jgi:CRISPR-associated endonuclease/helicase Cas3
MIPSPFPDWLDAIWAKSPDRGEGGEPESLAQHTWAVLERLTQFIRLRPSLPAQLGRDDLWQLLYWSVFFHDFGKVVPAFQGILRSESRSKQKWGKHRHEVFSLAFLSWVETDLTSDQLLWIAAAVVSHHRDLNEINSLYPPLGEDEDDPLASHLREIKTETLQGLWKWLSTCAPAWIQILGLSELGVKPLSVISQQEAIEAIYERGAKNIRRLLKLYRKFVQSLDEKKEQEFLVSALTLRGHIINADHGGSAHVAPMPVVQFSKQDIIEKREIKPENLFPHQVKAGEVKGSALLVAPTGSGKTEAALFWASQHKDAPRLFYTLPYQASMNAMNIRLEEIFGRGNVGLQHGRGLSALYRQLMERNYSPKDAARTAKQMKNLAELNHPPVRIFSPYQMLKGMYRLKGYEAQLSDYHNALFIFDEIHAYEIERLAMILMTMQYLRKYYNARFFVMSATFPTLIKGWLKEVLANPTEIVAEESLYQEFQRHILQVVEGDLLAPENLKKIADEAKAGKSVLVVCNIVARAQQVFDALSVELKGVVPVELLHGRFNMRDRVNKEKFIREKAGTRRKDLEPVVLVATQVVEVSLDIDLNTIYTDPAPLEALVQRFGRVNRGRKMDLARVHVFTQPDDGQRIYNPDLISRTLKILRRENNKPIDEKKVGHWLDEIYADKIAEQWQKEFSKAADEFNAVCIQTLRPFGATDDGLEEQFSKMFDGIEVLPNDLFDEYESQRESEPIAANELLVPMRWGQYHMLLKKGLMKPGDKTIPPVALTPYSPNTGLILERKSKDDHDWD